MNKKLFRISIITKTPLAQIETSTKTDIYIKKMPVYLTERGMFVDMPYYSANGWRGLFHRVVAKKLISKAFEKGIKFSVADIHLLTAGGGSNYSVQDYETELKVKELNPVVSLFGASLAIKSKLAIGNFMPDKKFILEMKEFSPENKESYCIPRFIDRQMIITKDDLKENDNLNFRLFLTKEDVEKWIKFVEENNKQRAKDRIENKNSEDKTKKGSIKFNINKEFVAPGVQFNSFIYCKEDLTDIEYGLMLLSIEDMVCQPLGSSSSIGYGLVDYSIYDEDDNNIIVAVRKDECLVDININTNYTEKQNYAINKAKEWLNDIKQENILLSKILINNAQKREEEKNKIKQQKAA
jgi:CRISPR type IV-associated protein Csf2